MTEKKNKPEQIDPSILPQKYSDTHMELAMKIFEEAHKAPRPWDPGYAEHRLSRMDPSIIDLFASSNDRTLGKATLDDFYNRSGLKQKYGVNTYPIFNCNKHLSLVNEVLYVGSYSFPVKIIESPFKSGVIVEFSAIDYLKFDAAYIEVLHIGHLKH